MVQLSNVVWYGMVGIQNAMVMGVRFIGNMSYRRVRGEEVEEEEEVEEVEVMLCVGSGSRWREKPGRKLERRRDRLFKCVLSLQVGGGNEREKMGKEESRK